MLLHEARRPARFDSDGELVLLHAQDPVRWDRELIAQGRRALERAGAPGVRGAFVLQAEIAAVHVDQPRNWERLAALHAELVALTGSPVAQLSRAVAVAEADGPAAGLALVDDLALLGYPYFHATRGELLRRLGRHAEARAALDAALALTPAGPDSRLLERRRAELHSGRPPGDPA